MGGKNKNFDEEKIKKSNFYKNKYIFNIYDVGVGRKLISKKETYGKNDNDK